MGRGRHARLAGRGPDLLDRHQFLALQTRVVADALRAVGTVFRAGAGLDRQQRRQLDAVGIEMPAVDLLRGEDQVRERHREQRIDLLRSPVVADLVVGGELWHNGSPISKNSGHPAGR